MITSFGKDMTGEQLAELHGWMESVFDTSHQCQLDLLLFGNAFYVKPPYPEHWRRLDPTKAIARRVLSSKRIGRRRYKWVFEHPDAKGLPVEMERLIP